PPREAGTVSLRMGDVEVAAIPLSAAQLLREFQLPAGAGALTVAATDTELDRLGMLELVPLTISPSAGPPARTLAEYGNARVYFFDSQVFVEGDGFWVRGRSTAE